jgi:hypothetical protein
MNTNTDQDLTSDDNISDQTEDAADLSKQFLHPGYTFKGQALRPYTAGTEMLFNQVFERDDAAATIFLIFIFIHVRDFEPLFDKKTGKLLSEGLISLCWDKLKFRRAFLIWIESMGHLSKEDNTEAMNLFEDIRGWARKSSVEVIPDPALPEKKTKATPRRRSPA